MANECFKYFKIVSVEKCDFQNNIQTGDTDEIF